MKKIILCDLDGTLADCSHRVPHITQKPRDWDTFFSLCDSDSPITHVIDAVKALSSAYEIYITSGRSDVCREKTEAWLKRQGVPYSILIMREHGDHTDDGILKPSWVESGLIPRDRVAFALDDRNRVVKAWRDLGIPCFQVAEGDF